MATTVAVLGSLHRPRSSPSVSSSSLLAPNPRSLPFPLAPPPKLPNCSYQTTSFQFRPRPPSFVCEAQNTDTEAAAVTDKTWQSVVIEESESPVLVEFWAPWCGPCRMMHPIIDELAKEYAGKLKCFKLNTDESPSVATQYCVRSIPTVIIFKEGEKKDAIIGAVPKSTITTSIEKFL